MKRILTSAIGVAVVAVATGGLYVGNAHADTVPPWEPDASSVGGLTFYNAAGTAITGGATSDPIAAYVEGNSAVRAGDNVATLYGYLPVSGQQPTQWSGEQLSGSTTYPNASAPGALGSATLPVVTGAAGDESIADLVADYPNTDVTSDGYAKAYQIRLLTSKPEEGISPTYDSADIVISGDGNSWSLLYTQAPGIATTTALTVKPASPVDFGTSVTLTASVTPAAAGGNILFKDGSKVLKSVVVSGGSATYKTSTLGDGTHSLTAKFVPDGTDYAPSTSTAHTLKVQAVATKTTLKASAKSIAAGKKLTLTAAEKPAVAGKITFFDGSKKLGKPVTVKKGKATLTTTKLAKGRHSLTATFKPKDTDANAPSTSKPVKVKVKG